VLTAIAALPAFADIGFSVNNCLPATPSGCTTTQAGATTITFDGLDGTLTPYTSGIATYSWTGGGSPFVTGNNSTYAAPPDDTTTYLTVGSAGSYPEEVDINFSVPLVYFGFYLGSPDSYNLIVFNRGAQIATFDGTTLIPPANGNQGIGDFVNFYVSGSYTPFDEIVMTSATPAFETDNHAYVAAVPEPASVLGLGTILLFLGSALKRKWA